MDPVNLSVDGKDFEDLFRSISIENTIITLEIEGDKTKPINTLVREIQRHPFRDRILHLDFFQVSMKESITVEVPIALLGTPVGVRTEGGILQHQMREVQISCLPSEIPEKIEIDISDLSIGESVHVRDLDLEDIDLLSDPDGLVVTLLPPTVIKEEVKPEAEEEEALEPELVGEEKEEGEEAPTQEGGKEVPPEKEE
jgi:large subunit ribosomal protein L25